MVKENIIALNPDGNVNIQSIATIISSVLHKINSDAKRGQHFEGGDSPDPENDTEEQKIKKYVQDQIVCFRLH
jgi:hypothetical protein